MRTELEKQGFKIEEIDVKYFHEMKWPEGFKVLIGGPASFIAFTNIVLGSDVQASVEPDGSLRITAK